MSAFLQQAQPILSILQWVVAIGAAIFMLYMRSVFAAKKDHDALASRVQGVEARCDRMNDRMTQSPTSKELHDLQLSIVELNGKLAVHNERMEGLEDLHKVMKRQVEVMDDYLRDRK